LLFTAENTEAVLLRLCRKRVEDWQSDICNINPYFSASIFTKCSSCGKATILMLESAQDIFLPVKDLKPSDPTYVYTTSENVAD
jgi:hypothetical protein